MAFIMAGVGAVFGVTATLVNKHERKKDRKYEREQEEQRLHQQWLQDQRAAED